MRALTFRLYPIFRNSVSIPPGRFANGVSKYQRNSRSNLAPSAENGEKGICTWKPPATLGKRLCRYHWDEKKRADLLV